MCDGGTAGPALVCRRVLLTSGGGDEITVSETLTCGKLEGLAVIFVEFDATGNRKVGTKPAF